MCMYIYIYTYIASGRKRRKLLIPRENQNVRATCHAENRDFSRPAVKRAHTNDSYLLRQQEYEGWNSSRRFTTAWNLPQCRAAACKDRPAIPSSLPVRH